MDARSALNIKVLKQRLRLNKIHCVKYHHNIDGSLQNSAQNCGELFLDEHDNVVILCHKPEGGGEEGTKEDHGHGEKVQVYSVKKSHASFHLEEVRGLIYGGLGSRFWMLRKHINTIPMTKYIKDQVPFYSWECLTIQLSDRDIDLVIPNTKQLFDLMTLLVYQLKTLDGTKGSAVKMLHKLSPDIEIDMDIRKRMVQGVIKKYKVMKLRNKLAYMAFRNKMTITQLFLSTILRVYMKLITTGELPVTLIDLYKMQIKYFNQVFHLPFAKAISEMITVNLECSNLTVNPELDLSKHKHAGIFFQQYDNEFD